MRLAREAVAKAPENSEFQGTLGAALYRLGDLDKAIPALTEAIRLRKPDDPLSSFNHYFMAMAQWQLGRHKEARESFTQAETLANTLSDSDKKLHGEPLALLRAEALGILGPAQ